MYLPVWAIILLGVGWLGFLWLLIRRDGGRDLDAPPRQFVQPLPMPRDATLSSGSGIIPPGEEAVLRQMAADGQKIQAIKRFRELTSCSLADAKDWVERL